MASAKISSIKNLLLTINISDYVYASGAVENLAASDDIVQRTNVLEISDTLDKSSLLLTHAIKLVNLVGHISTNQLVPWRLDHKMLTWHRMTQHDVILEDIESPGQSPPIIALCVVHPNSIAELLIVKLPANFRRDALSLFHSNGLQILSSTSPIENSGVAALLSSAERNCLLWCAKGKTSYEMGLILGLSEHTINHYLGRVLKKLDVSTRAQAVAAAIKKGVIPLECLD